MRLELEDETVIDDPTDADIAAALRSVSRGENTFVILGRSEMTYLQAMAGDNDGFVLEYQDGSLSDHYQSQNKSISLEQVVEAFQKYSLGDDSWRTRFGWERV